MSNQDLDSSASGYLSNSFEGISHVFTDVEILNTSEVNVVAKAKRYGRWWLLKGLRKEVAGEAAYQQRLRKELEILMQMQHPNVVATYGFEEVEGLGHCIVMEFVDGPTLKQWLDEQPQRQLKLKVAQEILDAVSYIHTKGIVHRDLKPANIIVTDNGSNVKLIDFGLADTDSHAVLKQPAGTPNYMSPEQMLTDVADVRNDIYSLGVIMRQMILGHRYQQIIKKCLLPIDHRFQTATELQNCFRSVDQRIKMCFAFTGTFLIASLLTLIGWQMWRAKGQEERMAYLQATYQQEQEAQQQKIAQLIDSTAQLRAYNQQMRDREAAAEAKREKVQDAINKGYAIINKAMRQTGIDQHLDTLSNMMYVWDDIYIRSQSGLLAIDAYLKQINPSFDDTEMDEIRNALYRQNEAIVTNWHNKIVNICK